MEQKPVEKKEKMLLVTCCAPCSPYIIDCLTPTFDLVLYFYNPNIYPRHEYELRKLEMACYASSLNLPFIEGAYDNDRWLDMTDEVKDEAEGGFRCEVCFRMRLNQACLYAAESGIRMFTTTYAISPYKNRLTINKVCQDLAHSYGLKYLDYDFRKKEGFKASMQMSKMHDFYMQKYCGCRYSLHETERRYERKHQRESVAQLEELSFS